MRCTRISQEDNTSAQTVLERWSSRGPRQLLRKRRDAHPPPRDPGPLQDREGLADTLKQEIDENSLQMAHFVYSQDGYFLQLAEKVASASGSVQYNYNNELAKGFQMAMVPAQDIVGGTFYMRNGAQVHMKENILLSTSAVQRERKRHGLL